MSQKPTKVKGTNYKLPKPDLDLELRIREELMMRENNISGGTPSETIHKDCMLFLNEAAHNVFDLIFADFPFNIGKDYGPEHNDALNYSDYVDFIHQFSLMALNAAKPTGTMVIMNNQRNAPIIFVEALKTGWYWQNSIIWPLRTGVPATNRLSRTYQVIQVFSKVAAENHFDPFSEMLEPDVGWGRKEKLLYDGKRRLHDIWYDIEKVHLMHPEALLLDDDDGGISLRYQATQMPLSLCLRILKTYAKPGGIILDAFAGSGAFSAAARALDFSQVFSCELNDEYREALNTNIQTLEKIAREKHVLQTECERQDSRSDSHKLQVSKMQDAAKEVLGAEEGKSTDELL